MHGRYSLTHSFTHFYTQRQRSKAEEKKKKRKKYAHTQFFGSDICGIDISVLEQREYYTLQSISNTIYIQYVLVCGGRTKFLVCAHVHTSYDISVYRDAMSYASSMMMAQMLLLLFGYFHFIVWNQHGNRTHTRHRNTRTRRETEREKDGKHTHDGGSPTHLHMVEWNIYTRRHSRKTNDGIAESIHYHIVRVSVFGMLQNALCL